MFRKFLMRRAVRLLSSVRTDPRHAVAGSEDDQLRALYVAAATPQWRSVIRAEAARRGVELPERVTL